ncbi:hypothetical protein LINPERHAP2_LOCUS22297 [Linum perenne]
MCTDKVWKVDNGLLPSDGGGLELTSDLIVATCASENLKTFSLSCGASGLAAAADSSSPVAGGGGEWSSFTRVLRALVRSRKGGLETELDLPLQISAHELMKCHVDVPSKIAWLNAQPIASPSFSLVSCKTKTKTISTILIL